MSNCATNITTQPTSPSCIDQSTWGSIATAVNQLSSRAQVAFSTVAATFTIGQPVYLLSTGIITNDPLSGGTLIGAYVGTVGGQAIVQTHGDVISVLVANSVPLGSWVKPSSTAPYAMIAATDYDPDLAGVVIESGTTDCRRVLFIKPRAEFTRLSSNINSNADVFTGFTSAPVTSSAATLSFTAPRDGLLRLFRACSGYVEMTKVGPGPWSCEVVLETQFDIGTGFAAFRNQVFRRSSLAGDESIAIPYFVATDVNSTASPVLAGTTAIYGLRAQITSRTVSGTGVTTNWVSDSNRLSWHFEYV